MKRGVRDNNIRLYKINNPQPQRGAQSQSPPQKRFLNKINNSNTKRHEFSMQNIELPPQKTEEKAEDFRVEIEKRFRSSKMNRDYVFPRKNLNDSESEGENSAESLRYVTTYDLTTQNFKSKDFINALLESKGFEKESDHHAEKHSDSYANEDSRSEEPAEVRNKDKDSATYRRLMKLLEQQRTSSQNSTNTNAKQIDKAHYEHAEPDAELVERAMNLKIMSHNSKKNSGMSRKQDVLSNFTTEASMSNAEGGFRTGHFMPERHTAKARNSNSSERISLRAETSDGPSARNGPKSLRLDIGRNFNAGLKPFFPQNVGAPKGRTPQYAIGSSNINDIFSREGMFKSYNNESMRRMHASTGKIRDGQPKGSNPLENLYKKAQKDIIQSKLRLPNGIVGTNKLVVSAHTSKNSQNADSATNVSKAFFKRDATPQTGAKPTALANFQISNPIPLERLSTMSGPNGDTRIPKQSSVRALHIISPLKNPEEMQFSKSSNTTQPKFYKKAFLKIEGKQHSQDITST